MDKLHELRRHLNSIIGTLDGMNLKIYCSQEFFDQLKKRCTYKRNKGELEDTVGGTFGGIAIEVKPDVKDYLILPLYEKDYERFAELLEGSEHLKENADE